MKIEEIGYSPKKIESNIMALQILEVLGREQKYTGDLVRSAYRGPYFAKMQKEGLIDRDGFLTEKARSSVAVPAREEDVYSTIERDNTVFVLSNHQDELPGLPAYKA